jgi:hypothetical protein
LWNSIKLPEPSNLPRALTDAGLKAAGIDPTTTVKINSSAIGGLSGRKKAKKEKWQSQFYKAQNQRPFGLYYERLSCWLFLEKETDLPNTVWMFNVLLL